jgi:hypothetical protein
MIDESNHSGPSGFGTWDTYEEALEDGLLQTLKSI